MSESSKQIKNDSGQREVVTLAGGCFWCSEAFFQETAGVLDVVSGYAGGEPAVANYVEVSKGTTEHREAVQVVYDPTQISIKEILDIYWSHIDPTDTEGQFADKGFQYTTAIYYHTENQCLVAEASKKALAESGLFNKPVATLILPFSTFFPAEDYHQDYYKKSSDHYESYKKGSGRSDFIEENWTKENALQFLKKEGEEVKVKGERKDGAEEEDEESKENDEYEKERKEKTTDEPVFTPRQFSEAEIEASLKTLPSEVFKVVAKEGTEPPFENPYWDNKEEGIYVDVVTGRPLFSSVHKYDSGTGWPSFYQSLEDANLKLKEDKKLFSTRTEVRSESGHLGHVFDDGPIEHGGKRYCLNSLALKFIPKADMKRLGYGKYLGLFG